MSQQAVYFVSDFHLGIDAKLTTLEREKKIVHWLESIAEDCGHLYLNGDTFDFWYEYRKVIPKGFSRFFGCLASLRDANIPIDLLIGNHDLWHKSYMTEEFGIPIHRSSIEREHFGKKLFIAHGDGLGPGDLGYKFLKQVFTSRFLQFMFSRLHPNFAVWLGNSLSTTSRKKQVDDDISYKGDDKEWLFQFCEEKIRNQELFDYYIFGHRHLPLDRTLSNGSKYLNSGDWLWHDSFIRIDAKGHEVGAVD